LASGRGFPHSPEAELRFGNLGSAQSCWGHTQRGVRFSRLDIEPGLLAYRFVMPLELFSNPPTIQPKFRS
jgi:hypothetical protein